MDEALLRTLTPTVIGILVRRGADFAAAEDAVQDALVEAVRVWPDDPPRDPKGWLVTVAWRKFLDAARAETSRRHREERVEARARARPGRGGGRHAPAVLPVRAPVPDPGLGRRAHAARGRRPDHAADRAGLPRAGGDHGPADQPGQADRLGRPVRPARRRRHGAARALPGLQRGLLRRRRPRRRGDPAHPPAGGQDRPRGGRGPARAHAAPPRAAPGPDRPRRQARAAGRAGPQPVGHRA